MTRSKQELNAAFAKAIQYVAKNSSYAVDQYTLKIYYESLEKYGIDNVIKGIIGFSKTSRHFPTINDIKKEMGIEVVTPKQLSTTLATRLAEAARKFGRLNIRAKRSLILDYVGDPKLVCFTSEEGFFSLYQNLADDKITVQQCASNLSNRVSKLSQEKIDEVNNNIESHGSKPVPSKEDIKEQATYVRSNFANDKEHQKKIDDFKRNNTLSLSQLKAELSEKIGVLD